MFATSIFVLTIITKCWCLTNIKIVVPSTVRVGDTPVLRCSYELEHHVQLYSVRWLKGESEFYKYTPSEDPPKKRTAIPSLQVLQTESNDTVSTVVLNNVKLENSGPFSCEISTGAPSFNTIRKSGTLQIVAVPKDNPVINGLKKDYNVGDVVTVECVSSGSQPAVNLTWTINDEEVKPDAIKHRYYIKNRNLLDTHENLEFRITSKLSNGRPFIIRCTAIMFDIFYKSCEACVKLGGKMCADTIEPTTSTTTKRPTTTTRRPTTQKSKNGSGTTSFILWPVVLLFCLNNN